MKLFIMRHGQASYQANSDRERPLTEMGIYQTQALLQANLEKFSDVKVIWSSDLTRAKQTARIASEILNTEAIEKSFLSPDDEVRYVLSQLESLDEDTCLLIVSHQPLVGELVSLLLHGNVYQSHPFTTSEVLALECSLPQPGLANLVAQFLPVA